MKRVDSKSFSSERNSSSAGDGLSTAMGLPIAVRVYHDLKRSQPGRQAVPEIDGMLVFDCETRTDQAQALTFGSYRFLVQGRCLEESLFYGDDLTACEHSFAISRYWPASRAVRAKFASAFAKLRCVGNAIRHKAL